MKSNLTISLDHETKVRFKEYCHQTRQSQSGVIEALIVEHLEKNGSLSQAPTNETGMINRFEKEQVII